MGLRTWVVAGLMIMILLTIQFTSSKSQEDVEKNEDLDLTLNDDNFNDIEYLIYLPKGDGAELRLIFTNKESSGTSIEYTLFGSNLELLDSDVTLLKNNTRNQKEFYGKLLPGQSSTDLYQTPGLCCDCYKIIFLNFNKTDPGVVFFQMDYKVTDEGKRCGLFGMDFLIIPVIVSISIVILIRKRK